ncbi:asparaginase [Sulfobacillus harzensis]|uniref:asparaginase n=1 Tax=Sulfobacillus harzensis TaxID=2729629 RepID=A0A7Y0L181_9FIRM|nr:asparaginase [Sulfobacillus harzensis]NMP21413.1 asparaginase [Sulfobacillus harzensis]
MAKTLLIIATGGTISSVPSAAGFVPGQSVKELTAALPIPDEWDLKIEDQGQALSSNFTLSDMNRVALRVVEAHADAVVVLHGTGVMEETAFLTDVRLAASGQRKSVVFTGAQRVASEPGADGLQNLFDAVRMAVHPQAWRLGAAIVFDGFVFSAMTAGKTDSWSLHAFSGGDGGALARVYPHGLRLLNWPAWRYPCSGDKLAPEVELVWFSAGMDGRSIALDNVRGMVLAASGVGNVNAAVAERLKEAFDRGISVVVATRTGAGGVFPWYGGAGGSRTLEMIGVSFTDLHPLKARILLMAALGNDASVTETFKGQAWMFPPE